MKMEVPSTIQRNSVNGLVKNKIILQSVKRNQDNC